MEAGLHGQLGLTAPQSVTLEFRHGNASVALLLLCMEGTVVWALTFRLEIATLIPAQVSLLPWYIFALTWSLWNALTFLLSRCVSSWSELLDHWAVQGSRWRMSTCVSRCHTLSRVCYRVLWWMLLLTRLLSVQQLLCVTRSVSLLPSRSSLFTGWHGGTWCMQQLVCIRNITKLILILYSFYLYILMVTFLLCFFFICMK